MVVTSVVKFVVGSISLIFTIIFRGIYSSDNESNGINEKKYKSKKGTKKDKV